jgi:hypothetical protein
MFGDVMNLWWPSIHDAAQIEFEITISLVDVVTGGALAIILLPVLTSISTTNTYLRTKQVR